MKGLTALALVATFVSCSKETDLYEGASKEKEFQMSFKNNVMGGLDIDPNQTWSTAANTDVKVSVNLDYGAEYTVYIFASAPVIGDAAYIGVTKVKSGETKTLTVARPAGVPLLYAACYDKDNHAICKPFTVSAKDTEVAFGESATRSGAMRATSTGNRWSVTPRNMPDLSRWMTGTLYEMQEAFNTNGEGLEVNQADGSEKHLKITGTYTGGIARIQSYANQSVYVTGTWNVPEDQRCTGSSVIVVGDGGTINVPAGHMLSTNANNEEETTGMIYVLPGGKITGAGTLQFSNGTETFSYNGGTLTVENININGGTLYNAGVMGQESASGVKPALTGPGGTDLAPSKFINLGKCYLSQVDGAGMAIENACNMYVTGTMALGKVSKMDDGSYIECGTLELNGSNGGGILMYMGNAAYMKCLGDASVNNFGVWGPAGSNYTANALFQVGGCSYMNYTSGDATQFLLDHVELLLPADFPQGVDYGWNGDANAINYGVGYIDDNIKPASYCKHMLSGWFNGYTDRLINGNNYDNVMIHDWGFDEGGNWYPAEYGWVWNDSNDKTSFSDDSRATCIYGTSPSYTRIVEEGENCGVTIKKTPDPLPQPNYYYYAFEDCGVIGDFDFNDVVLRASAADEDDYFELWACAAGGEFQSEIFFGVGDSKVSLGEIHSLLGVTASAMTNTGGASDVNFQKIGRFALGDYDIDNLPFTIRVTAGGKLKAEVTTRLTATASRDEEGSNAPLYVVVMGNNQGVWNWPKERVNIGTAFTGFATWGSDVTSETMWYNTPVAGNVYTYSQSKWATTTE